MQQRFREMFLREHCPEILDQLQDDLALVTTRCSCQYFAELLPFDEVVVHHVYSTWSMAHHMEIAARKVLVPHLEDHEEGIGSHLSIDHLAPTPVGQRVRIVAEAVELEPTTLVCKVNVYHLHPDGPRHVGKGRQVQQPSLEKLGESAVLVNGS